MRGQRGNRGFRRDGRGGFSSRSRGRGMASNFHIHQPLQNQIALQIAESHQCNNLSFETKDPATKHLRIYVGNICKQRVERPDLYVIFSKYGTITAISHLTCKNPTDHCSFAFVQYTTTEAAEKAVLSENGQGYYGYSLDVKLADFNVNGFRGTPANSVSTSFSNSTAGASSLGFSKRTSAGQHSTAPSAKKIKIDAGPPDILVCGSCHCVFDGIEAMIQHKRNPCRSLKKCRCDEENIPDALICAICMKRIATPWQLIRHIQRIHTVMICNNAPDGNSDEVAQADDLDEEEFIADEEEEHEGLGLDTEIIDEDNDLMEEVETK